MLFLHCPGAYNQHFPILQGRMWTKPKGRVPAQTSSQFGRLERAEEGEELIVLQRGSPSTTATHHCQKLRRHHSSSGFMETNAVLYQPRTWGLAGPRHTGFPFHRFWLQQLLPSPCFAPHQSPQAPPAESTGVLGKVSPPARSRLLSTSTTAPASCHGLLLLPPKLNPRRPNPAKCSGWPSPTLLRGYSAPSCGFFNTTLRFRSNQGHPKCWTGAVRSDTRADMNFWSDAFYYGTSAFFETRKRNKVPLLFCSPRDANVVKVNPDILWKCSREAKPHVKSSINASR